MKNIIRKWSPFFLVLAILIIGRITGNTNRGENISLLAVLICIIMWKTWRFFIWPWVCHPDDEWKMDEETGDTEMINSLDNYVEQRNDLKRGSEKK